ncbi:MAG: ABC transporter ATP-binding protein [Pseudomonadota bacterium]
MNAAALSVSSLDVNVPGRQLVKQLSFAVDGGEMLAVLGRNGTGKSLTLHSIAGLRDCDAGSIRIDGSDRDTIDGRELARRIALLPQHADDVFPSSVLETAMTGRYPHVPALSWETSADVAITHDALADMDLAALANRDVLTLSGGERRRLAIAQVLAQQPAVYLLDEPINHLDPQHQLDVMRRFRQLADEGCSVVVTLHDVNLAARFADRCLLLFGDGRWELGESDRILTAEHLSELYATPMQRLEVDGTALFVSSGLVA